MKPRLDENRPSRHARSQRGIALITAVLVVSLSVIAATAVLDAGHYAILRTATMQNSELAWEYAEGAEDWVRTALQLDKEDLKHQYDGLDELWAQPQTFPIDHGFLQGEVIDALGRFNLNNLGKWAEQENPNIDKNDPTSFAYQKGIFVRLIENIPDASNLITQPEDLANAISDWIDPGDEPTEGNGKEDLDYQILDPAHLAANRPMASITELRSVLCALYDCKQAPDVPRRIYDLLRPHIIALPVEGVTPININTATPALLLAVSIKLEPIIESRKEDPIQNIDDIPAPQGAGFTQTEIKCLDVSTTLFLLRVSAVVGSAEDSATESSRVALYSLIFRPKTGTPVVLSRSTDTE